MEIKKIHTDKNLTIVEFVDDGVRQRRKLPFTVVGDVSEDLLSLELPFGVVWSDAVFPFIKSPEQISEDLDKIFYNNGVFTKDDLRNANPNKVHGMLLSAFGIDYNKFMKLIENYLEA